jgi:hypothetical protein
MVFAKALLGAMPAALLCWANSAAADNAAAQSAGELDAIVVTAKKRPDPVAGGRRPPIPDSIAAS